MQLFDSVTKQKLPFEPITPGEARIYVCGPTVYDDAHLGHARSAVAFDLLRRTLGALGYRVTFVSNITDIDDKIIKKVQQTGTPMRELTAYYLQRYRKEMAALGVQAPDIAPKATESLEAIIRMIATLMQNGTAYRTENGDVWFDTSKDEDYGNLSHRVHDETAALSRIVHEGGKRNSQDFALWKSCKEDEDICFDSPFGKGRPGWHIECSAMIASTIASAGEYAIDIHGGGADLFFPHHENEAAQTRCASHQKLAKYWMHNGFVTIGGEKMSKSLGNSFFLKDALNVYPGEVLRFYLMATHYRQNFNFNETDLLAAKKRLDKLYRLKKRVYGIAVKGNDTVFEKALLEALSDDLNISKALAAVDEMVATANEHLDNNPKDKAFKQKIAADIRCLEALLGIGGQDAFAYFQTGVDAAQKEKIESMIKERTEAKKAKAYEHADAIRNALEQMSVQIMDTPQGTLWEIS